MQWASLEETHEARIRQYEVEFWKKLAIPAACIVFVLIGAPIGIRFPRGGVGMVIMVSLAVFAVYYAGLIGGESLADEGILTPFWAMWSANIAFLVVGLWAVSRIGRESATSRGGGWDDLAHTIRRALTGPLRVFRPASRRA
jgi:lipopolysaccharide export system permease protein